MNMKGSGASAINSFSGGMVSDVDVLSTKNNTYKYAENARIAQEGSVGSLSNIEDFEHLIELPSDAGEFMAYYSTSKYTILVSKDVNRLHVYKYAVVDGDETIVKVATLIDSIDDDRIANIKHLSITASIESDKLERLYIADGIHSLYSINMYSSTMPGDNINLEIYRDSALIGRYFSSYDPSISYSHGDVVPYNGFFWRSLIDSPLIAPTTGVAWESLGAINSKLRVIQSTTESQSFIYITMYTGGRTSTHTNTYKYLGYYSPTVIYQFDDIVLYDDKFYRCSHRGGSATVPTNTDAWEFIDDFGFSKIKPDLSAQWPSRYTFEIDLYGYYWFGEYKQNWSAGGQYSASDVVIFDGKYYGSLINSPTGRPDVSPNWEKIQIPAWSQSGQWYPLGYVVEFNNQYYVSLVDYTESEPSNSLDWKLIDPEGSNIFINKFTPIGSIFNYIDGFNYPYRGSYESSTRYLKDDVVLMDGIYWKFKLNFGGRSQFNTSSAENIGEISDIGYTSSMGSESVTTKRLYKYTTLLGIYRGQFINSYGYYPGEIVLNSGGYYKALVFNPTSGPSDPSSWELIIMDDDPLFTISHNGVSDSVVNVGVPVYDVAKIQVGSSLYKKPDVEISTDSGGSLSIGKYYYVIKYTSNAGSESSEMYVSNGVNATKSNSSGGIIDAETGAADISNIGISLLISGVDNDAYGLNVYRIYYNGSGVGYKASLIYSDKISRINGVAYPINIFDSSDSDILNDVSDSILFNKNIVSSSVIENKDGILFAGNINIEKDSILNYDTRSFAFDHTGSFKYRNITDTVGTSPYEIKIQNIGDDESGSGLNGKDNHDFINDDIYTKDRYRDVKYRYKFSDDQLNGKVYGGCGKNVSYEFIHTYLIAAKESSIFTNSDDNDWFKIESFKKEGDLDGDLNINSEIDEFKDWSCKSLIDVNIHRDDLVIKVGDKDRPISKMTIRNQMQTALDEPLDIVDISAFGIKNHTGKLDYSNALIANTFSGFKRNEIFRFAVRFKLKNGTHTEPMWISDIRFPANYMTGMASHSGSNETAPPLFSFSSFVAPEDTEEGIDLINTTITNATSIVKEGFGSIEYEDKLGSNELSRAELLVKPLGIKFEFDNVPENVESAKILYQELSPIERTILGQFIVSRIGMFSNSGSELDPTGNVYYESNSNGFCYPHPTPSMKYSYGIMPLNITQKEGIRTEYNVAINGFTRKSEERMSFDAYSSVATPIIIGDNNLSGHGYWGKSDKRLSRTSAVSTSPYFSDIKNYMLISPEISYIGDSYTDIVSSIGNNIVFENLIYSKNTKTSTVSATSITNVSNNIINSRAINLLGGYPSSIPFVGAIYAGEGIPDQTAPKYNFDSYYNPSMFWGSDFDSPPFNYNSGDQNDHTDYFAVARKFIHAGVPGAMYTASYLNEEERISSSAENLSLVVTLGMCGAPLYSVVEAVLSYKAAHSDGVGRIGDSIFKIEDGVSLCMSSTKYTDGLGEINGRDINIQSNIKIPNVKYIISEPYVPGNKITISNHKKGYEKVWDDGTTGNGAITNFPISLKTFMSGNGIVVDAFNFYPLTSSGESQNRIISKYANNAVKMTSYRLDDDSSSFGRVGSLNSATMKYYKSIIPSRNYHRRNPTNFGIDEYNDSYISIFKQNGVEFDDYDFYLSNKSGVKLRDYSPYKDIAVGDGYNSVWDFKPLSIKKSMSAPIISGTTGPFDLSRSVKLDGYSGYVNYSKSLSADMFGRKDQIGSSPGQEANASIFSALVKKSGSGIGDSSEFRTMKNYRRGRLSGKHGAGIIVSLSDSIPMVGHIMSNDYKLDAFLNLQLSRYILRLNYLFDRKDIIENGNAMYAEFLDQLRRTRLYWHMVDGACSAHTSTYLVDIRSKTNKLFKSASLTDKRNAKYIESAQSINLGSGSSHKYYVFGGGTYVTMFDYTNTYGNKPEPHASYNNDPKDVVNWNSVTNACNTSRLNMLVPIESSINTHVDSGDTFHKHNDPWMLETTVPGINSPNSGYSSSVVTTQGGEDEFMYSDSFSAKKDFNAIENNFSKDDVYNSFSYKSRVIASEKKTLGEQNDSWAIFKLNNYIDLNPSNGSINGMETIGNRLYAFQDNAIASLSVNERSLITDSSGDNSQLLLGTGGILPYYNYLSESYGLSPDTMSAINKSSNGIYFYDKINQSICRISNVLTDLSSSTNTRLISKSISASNSSILLPWTKNGEILFKFDNISYLDNSNKSILFSEPGSTFESFLRTGFDYVFEFGSDIRVIRNVDDIDGIYKPTENIISSMVVSFVTNESIMNTKIFDSIDMNLSWTHNNTINDKDDYDDDINIYAKYSNSISNTGLFKPLTHSSLSRQNKNGDIHYSIPRVNNTISKMRDKYINSTYSFDGGYDISLPYVKTNYRYSAI